MVQINKACQPGHSRQRTLTALVNKVLAAVARKLPSADATACAKMPWLATPTTLPQHSMNAAGQATNCVQEIAPVAI